MATRIYYSEEAERTAKRQRLVSIIVFSVLGMAMGGILAMLFAPPAKKSRMEKLADEVGDGFKAGRDVTSDALKRLEQEYLNLRDQVDRIVNSVKN
jgi:hypothetical protein